MPRNGLPKVTQEKTSFLRALLFFAALTLIASSSYWIRGEVWLPGNALAAHKPWSSQLDDSQFSSKFQARAAEHILNRDRPVSTPGGALYG